MIELILATSSVHKIREIREMLREFEEIELFTLREFPDYHLPPETGKTFRENAELKAIHAAQALNKYVLADDSGLIVPALKGEPGVYSARYAGSDTMDGDNRKKLLAKMSSLEGLERSASFVCCLCLAGPDGLIRSEEGISEGEITEHEQGGNGFGYDSLFRKHDYNQTLAELDETTKNRISHRRKAFDRIRLTIEHLVNQSVEETLV